MDLWTKSNQFRLVLLKFSTPDWYLQAIFSWKFHLNGTDAYTREGLTENITFAYIKNKTFSAAQLRSFSRITMWLRPAPISQTDIFSKSAQLCSVYQAFGKSLARCMFSADPLGTAAVPHLCQARASCLPGWWPRGCRPATAPAAPVPTLLSRLLTSCSFHGLPIWLLNMGRLNAAFSLPAYPSFFHICHLSAHCCQVSSAWKELLWV